ncbi:MAG: hypothetical protein ACI8RZ_003022 [Myxococcota bacterium]|jgi:hypothetical protein
MLLLSLTAFADPGAIPTSTAALIGLPEPAGWHRIVDDLDGDGQPDIVLRIQQLCVGCEPVSPHTDEATGVVTERAGLWGLMIVASGGNGLTLGAGTAVTLPVSDWELVDGAPVWTHGTQTQAFGPDLTTVHFLGVKDTGRGCAPGQSALVLSGTDAAWALLYREGSWRYVSCGF